MGQKRQPFTSTVEASISQFWEDMDTLKSDLDDTLEAMSEKMHGTSKYAALEDARNAVDEQAGDAPDVPEFLSDTKVEYINDTRSRESRAYAVRRDNMCAMLQGAIDAIHNVIDDHGDEFKEEQISEAEDLLETLEDTVLEIEGISFD